MSELSIRVRTVRIVFTPRHISNVLAEDASGVLCQFVQPEALRLLERLDLIRPVLAYEALGLPYRDIEKHATELYLDALRRKSASDLPSLKLCDALSVQLEWVGDPVDSVVSCFTYLTRGGDVIEGRQGADNTFSMHVRGNELLSIEDATPFLWSSEVYDHAAACFSWAISKGVVVRYPA